MRAGEVYINPASGERAIVVLGTDETGGKRIVIDLYLPPGGGMMGSHQLQLVSALIRLDTSRYLVGDNCDEMRALPEENDLPFSRRMLDYELNKVQLVASVLSTSSKRPLC